MQRKGETNMIIRKRRSSKHLKYNMNQSHQVNNEGMVNKAWKSEVGRLKNLDLMNQAYWTVSTVDFVAQL